MGCWTNGQPAIAGWKKVTVFKVSPKEWESLSMNAHKISFKEIREPSFNRYDFILVATSATEILGYATVIEFDQESAYMQHGGAMPNIKGTSSSFKVYIELIKWLKQNFKKISTRIQNTNIVMIKFALSVGFLIDGVISYRQDTFLSLGWGFQDA